MAKEIKAIFNDYRVEFKTKFGVDFIIECATEDDIEEIVNCYDSVWISNKNIVEKLDVENENSFYNCGGMFNKLTEQHTLNLINSDKDIIFVLRRPNDKKISSLLWLSTNTNPYDELIFYESVDRKKKELINQYRTDKYIMCPMDFISLPNKKNRGTSYIFLRSVYEKMLENGYMYAFIEIYTIVGYYNKYKEYVNLNSQNKRSVILNEKICAENIGTTGTHDYKKGDYTVITKSEIYGLDIKAGVDTMKKRTW